MPVLDLAQDGLDILDHLSLGEEELLDRLSLFEPLSSEEKMQLRAKIAKRHFKAGEQLLRQGVKADSVQFVFCGLIQVTHQAQDARELKLGRLGPGDSFGKISLPDWSSCE
jgi:ATP-binding cassette, subfamily B, bacterial HlyB/CyaB